MSFYVYKITNLVNGKIYVGKATSIKARWSKHKTAAIAKNPNDYTYFHKAMNKYGFDNFKVEQVAEYKTEREALDAEIFYIKEWKCRDKNIGYNLTDGGDGASGFKHSEETKIKMSESKKGANVGEENPFFGKEHSEKAKNAIREKQNINYELNKEKIDAMNIAQCQFNTEECIKIQKLYLSGFTIKQIVSECGSNDHVICRILSGKYMSIKNYSIITSDDLKRIKDENIKKAGARIRKFQKEEEFLPIIKDFQDGMSIKSLGIKYMANRKTISKVLKEHNVVTNEDKLAVK